MRSKSSPYTQKLNVSQDKIRKKDSNVYIMGRSSMYKFMSTSSQEALVLLIIF
ncbi:MAG: hypothetical protein ACTSU2_03220 [Promethearchaeota archaeon]